jgi:putative DNA methylase
MRLQEGLASGILRDTPSLIERVFPAQQVSIEAQAERKSGAGQTLTALGSYWKGRKPLVLVRACILGTLLPATEDPEMDLEIFELLMAMDDNAFTRRMKSISKEDVQRWGGPLVADILDEQGAWKVSGGEKQRLLGEILAKMPYGERLNRRSRRPEELPESAYDPIWGRVNAHLGTTARSHSELVEQLGIARFGRRPRLADTFCGGGAIPFEAARLGCDVYASDLNPIACMLTWGALNVIGADDETRAEISRAQSDVVRDLDQEIIQTGIETSADGSRAKAYLYCLEAICPETGWSVPLASSWVISKNKRCVARLVPNQQQKRFEVEIREGASDEELDAAKAGTVQDGHLVYELAGEVHRTSIKSLRGDRRVDGEISNELRLWKKADVGPASGDTFQERLYCVQWITRDGSLCFKEPSEHELQVERAARSTASDRLAQWQRDGFVPENRIEPGNKTSEPIRTRGWTYWHHAFHPRQLIVLEVARRAISTATSATVAGTLAICLCNVLDKSSKLGQWRVGHAGRAGVAPAGDYVEHVFYNQALNVFFNYGVRALGGLTDSLTSRFPKYHVTTSCKVENRPASEVATVADIFITDPPYADAVHYHEITEYFIAWLRKNPPEPFKDWIWDSRRPLAIQGSGEDFRREMVSAYSAMSAHMADNGLQLVMFTHQDASVWADMAGIFWGAGLRVTAAWYIATETSSELKKGGYVQGTVILVLRKRTGTERAYKDELATELRKEVAHQIETLVGLSQRVKQRGRTENLFEDSDLQMAGYAAALRVLTSYTHIEATDMTREALRPRKEGQPTIADEMIDFAVQIANEYLIPTGLNERVWSELTGSERFYLRMIDVESTGAKKLDNYQNFAKAFRVGDYERLMASERANDARLKSAREFKREEFGETEFGKSKLRAVLFAILEIEQDVESESVLAHLHENVDDYFLKREHLILLAAYLAIKLEGRRDEEASASRVLRDLIKGERLGA